LKRSKNKMKVAQNGLTRIETSYYPNIQNRIASVISQNLTS